jgi:hypothetical protein
MTRNSLRRGFMMGRVMEGEGNLFEILVVGFIGVMGFYSYPIKGYRIPWQYINSLLNLHTVTPKSRTTCRSAACKMHM